MCFDDRDTCSTRTYLRSGRQYDEATGPYGMSWRRRHDLGGAYYPSRYYTQLPTGRYVGNYRQSYGRRTGMGYSTACGPGHGRRYLPAARATMPGSAATVSFLLSSLPQSRCPRAFPCSPTTCPASRWCLPWQPLTISLHLVSSLLFSSLPYSSLHLSSPLFSYPVLDALYKPLLLTLLLPICPPSAPPSQSVIANHGGHPEAAPPVHLHSPLWATWLTQLCWSAAKRRIPCWRDARRL